MKGPLLMLRLRKSACLMLPRAQKLHCSSTVNTYQINYDHLKEGVQNPKSLVNSLPSTVAGNVKNVVGWRGGAERGFLAAYPDCIHVLSMEATKDFSQLTPKYLKVFTQSLSANVLGQRYGILVPITYRQLRPKATKDQMKLAHVMGWCAELVRASKVMGDELCQAESSSSSFSLNDVLVLERGIFVLLSHFFRADTAMFAHCVEALQEGLRMNVMSRALLARLHSVNEYDIPTYKSVVRSNFSYVNFCLPVSLALFMGELNEPKVHDQAHVILNEIGYFLEVTRDFVNCYVDPEGKDIQEGRISWLIIYARQRANASQMAILEQCYGQRDEASVNQVKQVYEDLKLKKIFTAHMNETREGILSRVQKVPQADNMSQEFFFNLMENMNVNKIS